MRLETTRLAFNRRYILVLLLLVLAIYVLVPQVGDFRSSWHFLRHPAPAWTIAAAALTMTTYLSAALNYRFLALRPLRYGQTVVVQLAAMFINRLLPGGIGALGANYAYLHRQNHTSAQAASVVGLNNLLGAAANGLLVAFSLAFLSNQVAVAPDYDRATGLWLKVALALILVGGVALVLSRQRFKRQVADLRIQLGAYQCQAWRLPSALISSILLTLGNVFCLWACAAALGIHLPFVVILLILSFGVGAGAATPTPGGLGGFEAGLAAGFIAYHVASPAALAVALLYRLISYWLPIVFGAPAFAVCRRQHWF